MRHKEKGKTMYKIYKLTFDDGAEYVGLTKKPKVTQRLHNHKSCPVNFELTRRFKQGENYTLEIISRHRTFETAFKREVKEIGKLVKPINRYHTKAPTIANGEGEVLYYRRPLGRLSRRKYERSRAIQKCSWCQRVLEAEHFCSDSSRSGGLSSRCNDCVNVKSTIRDLVVRGALNITQSDAYYYAKGFCVDKMHLRGGGKKQ